MKQREAEKVRCKTVIEIVSPVMMGGKNLFLYP